MMFKKRWFHRHNWKVRPFTITEHGASFVCVKCLDTKEYLWRSPMEVNRARIILTIKETDKMLKKHGII